MLLFQGRISPPTPPPHKKYDFMCNWPGSKRNCGKMYSRHLFPYGGLFLLALKARGNYQASPTHSPHGLAAQLRRLPLILFLLVVVVVVVVIIIFLFF